MQVVPQVAGGGWRHYGQVVYVQTAVPAIVQGTSTAVPYSAFYTHLSSISAPVQTAYASGGSVDANTQLGTAGETVSTQNGTQWICTTTDQSMGVHLHFAVYQGAQFCGLAGDPCQGSYGPYNGKAVIPEPLVGQGGAYENFEWWRGPAYPMTAMDLATGTPAPGGSWTAGSVTNGEQIGVNTPVPINIAVHDRLPIKQVNITAYYPNWNVVTPPFVGTPTVTPSFPSNDIWRILAVCGGSQPVTTCSSGATWDGTQTSGTINYSWNPWSETGTIPPVVPWLPPASPAPSASKVPVCISFDIIDTAGVEKLAPNGVLCRKITSSSQTQNSGFDQDATSTRASASRLIVLAPFTIVPSLTIAPSSGVPGSTAAITGTGYGANETVTLKWNCSTSTCSSTTVLGTAQTDANGGFSNLSVAIPATAPAGITYAIGGIGQSSKAFASTTFYVGNPNTWWPTGSMTVARYYHTATLLPSGQVLVAGGCCDSHGNSLDSAELYNPSTGTWTPTGSMSVPRADHTATLLPDGKVLVAGGISCNTSSSCELASAELYDPGTGTWTPTGSMTVPRSLHTATLLPDGTVLVAGGGDCQDCYWNSAEVYNPATGVWTATGSMAVARWSHTATLLPNGTVLVAGGETNGYAATVDAEIYNPSTRTWSDTGPLATARLLHTATLLSSGQVLVAGGYTGTCCGTVTSSAELYDPSSGTWSPVRSMTVPREGHTATLLGDGTVLVAGGNGQTAEVYQPSSGTWTPTASMAVPRTYQTATLLKSGQVLVAGGLATSTAELYTPSSP